MDDQVSEESSKLTIQAEEMHTLIVPENHRKSLLVLGGGGVRAAAEIGAYLELRRSKLFEREGRTSPREIRGSSGGFIVAIPIGLGASEDLLLEIARTIPYEEFDDTSIGFVRDTWRFLAHYGARKGDRITEWIRELIGDLTGDPDLTFGDLWRLEWVRKGQLANLSCVSVDVDTGRVVVSSYRTTPNRKIWEAARRSLSIPFYFQALRSLPEFANLEIDGGVLDNYPIKGFDRDGEAPSQVVGVRVGDNQDVDRGSSPMFDTPCNSLPVFAKRCFQLIYNRAQNSHLNPEDWSRTVWVDGLGIPATKFGISRVEVERLIESGERGAREWVEWYVRERIDEEAANGNTR